MSGVLPGETLPPLRIEKDTSMTTASEETIKAHRVASSGNLIANLQALAAAANELAATVEGNEGVGIGLSYWPLKTAMDNSSAAMRDYQNV